MRVKNTTLIRLTAFALIALALSACSNRRPSDGLAASPRLPAAAPLPSDSEAVEQTTRFLENRIKRDPEDFIAHNKVSSLYLQRVRETGDVSYLNLAARAARTSLATLPAEQNTGGLAALTQVEYASHEFAAARDHATQLTVLEPNKSYPFQMLGDALLELGEYDKAEAAFRRMEQLGGLQGLTRVAIEQRIARLAALRGDTETATRSLTAALTIALGLPIQSRETVAWCRWQLGETAFAVGDYSAAEQHYLDALITFPNYFRALASLGRVRAAIGDLPGAIEQYEQVVKILPDPSFVTALGDLYKLANRDADAARQYALVEQIARINAAGGALYNRQQAMFYADHDIKLEEAYLNASREYATRRDIYGADAVAWTAFKAGKQVEAQSAIKQALRLGTRDAKLFYHAGMIALAVGNKSAARDYLNRALAVCPQFDPLQTAVARKALEE